MWQIEKQVRDERGVHRWQSAGPERYATRADAEKAVRRVGLRFLRDAAKSEPRPYSARLRVVLAAVAACMVLQ